MWGWTSEDPDEGRYVCAAGTAECWAYPERGQLDPCMTTYLIAGATSTLPVSGQFEALIIRLAQGGERPAIARQFGLAWHEVVGVMARTVRRGSAASVA